MLQPRLELRVAEPEHVRGEPVAGKLAGAPATKHRLGRDAEESGDLARR
jgi:hypothetical protein